MAANSVTTFSDLPEVILPKIFAAVSNTRTRNSLSLINRGFLLLERQTRTSLTLRGNARDLHEIPSCHIIVPARDIHEILPSYILVLGTRDR